MHQYGKSFSKACQLLNPQNFVASKCVAIALFVTADARRLTRMDEKGDRFFTLHFTHSNWNGLQRNLANRYLKAFSSYYRHLGDSCLFLRRISAFVTNIYAIALSCRRRWRTDGAIALSSQRPLIPKSDRTLFNRRWTDADRRIAIEHYLFATAALIMWRSHLNLI